MITIEQCRGARGILAWTQQDLADASGLSKTAINNFEKQHSDIKAESLRAIRLAFESAEIEFLGTAGVSKRTENTRFLRGPSALNDLIGDIHRTLQDTGGEILITRADKSLASQISTQTLFKHIEFLKDRPVTQRILSTDGSEQILSPEDQCRFLSEAVATSAPCLFIYGSKIAFELWDRAMIVIVDSAIAAAAERDRFETLWMQAQKNTGQGLVANNEKRQG